MNSRAQAPTQRGYKESFSLLGPGQVIARGTISARAEFLKVAPLPHHAN